MRSKKVTRSEAEAAYTRELAGSPFTFGSDIKDAVIVGVRLPDLPTPGGAQGKGYLPLTYEYELAGERRALVTQDGPEIDEVRAFLHGTLPELAVDERVELWFEEAIPFGPSCC
ncbi:MAG: hypothetical protein M5U22_20160 [Thermoleophilia bacterium]|nr:hypothetical protein [Thermoleophilia bacterium]